MLRSSASIAVLLAILAAPAWAAQDSAGAQTRDWSRIDTDRDNLVSAEEMDKFLKETWAKQDKQETMAEQDKKDQRDWSKIDTDRDNLVSAQEMDKFLKETWAKQDKQETMAEQDKKDQ